MTKVEAKEKALKSTILLFKEIKNFPSPVGTGILVHLEESYFLISASHVYDENGLFIISNSTDQEIVVGGELHKTVVPKAEGEYDHIDIAILKIDPSIVEDLKKDYHFLNSEQLLINHKVDRTEQHYLILGYPGTQTKKRFRKDEIKSRVFSFWSMPKEQEYYSSIRIEEHTNILLHIDAKRVVNSATRTTQKAPELEGISGCGLWYFNQGKLGLVGIIYGKNQHPGHKTLFSTRIDVITETIRHIYKIDIPQSGITKVNIKSNNKG